MPLKSFFGYRAISDLAFGDLYIHFNGKNGYFSDYLFLILLKSLMVTLKLKGRQIKGFWFLFHVCSSFYSKVMMFYKLKVLFLSTLPHILALNTFTANCFIMYRHNKAKVGMCLSYTITISVQFYMLPWKHNNNNEKCCFK